MIIKYNYGVASLVFVLGEYSKGTNRIADPIRPKDVSSCSILVGAGTHSKAAGVDPGLEPVTDQDRQKR